MKSTLFVLVLIGATAFPVFPQSAIAPNLRGGEEEVLESRLRETDLRRIRAEKKNDPTTLAENAKSAVFMPKPNAEQRKQLLLNAEDFSPYKTFLNQPKSGLVKIFPDFGCGGNETVVSAAEKCLDWIPGSNFYSFREKDYSNKYLADIHYKNGLLISEGVISQGIFVNLGDVAPENVDLQTDGVKFLHDYKPESESKKALQQIIKINAGVKDGKFIYRNSIAAKENSTFALRVVAYRGEFFGDFHGRKFDWLSEDNRSDVLIVFRIVKLETNGTATIIWKELNRQKSPRIVATQNN